MANLVPIGVGLRFEPTEIERRDDDHRVARRRHRADGSGLCCCCSLRTGRLRPRRAKRWRHPLCLARAADRLLRNGGGVGQGWRSADQQHDPGKTRGDGASSGLPHLSRLRQSNETTHGTRSATRRGRDDPPCEGQVSELAITGCLMHVPKAASIATPHAALFNRRGKSVRAARGVPAPRGTVSRSAGRRGASN